MKSAFLTEPKKIEIRETPVPSETTSLVKIAYCGICTLEQRFSTVRVIYYPLVPGHEARGTVRLRRSEGDDDVHAGTTGARPW